MNLSEESLHQASNFHSNEEGEESPDVFEKVSKKNHDLSYIF